MADVPRFYDIDSDEFRPVTQADVDILMETVQSYGKLMTAMRTINAELVSTIKDIRKPKE